MRRMYGKMNFAGLMMIALCILSTVASPVWAQTGGVRREGVIADVGVPIEILFCGDLANNTTNYLGPASGFAAGTFYASGTTANDTSFALAGSGCSALDSATEATADTVLYANNALKILGMACTVDSSGSNGLTLNLRASAANLTPNISVAIATTKTTGATVAFTTTNVAANAPMAVRVVAQGEDMSSHDAWCIVHALVIP